jgi:hypothetical protein
MRHQSVSIGIALLLVATSSGAQDWRPAPPERRRLSRWGASDERGAANHMAPETVMRAVRLIKEGKVYELGRVLEPAMPLFGIRTFSLHTARSSAPTGVNQLRAMRKW